MQRRHGLAGDFIRVGGSGGIQQPRRRAARSQKVDGTNRRQHHRTKDYARDCGGLAMQDTQTTLEPSSTAVRFNLRQAVARNRHFLFPILALILVLLGNRIISPTFFSFRMVDGRLIGSLVDILNRGAPTVLLATGMTLVIA